MRWTYDPAVDALTILFLPGRRSAKTDELRSGMLCDYDRKGHPISIEILDASRHFPAKELSDLSLPEEMVPLSEASRRNGLDASTLRHQVRSSRHGSTVHATVGFLFWRNDKTEAPAQAATST